MQDGRIGSGPVPANDQVDALLNCLLGPDVEVFNVNLSARDHSAAVFSGKLGVLGFDSGIILSSGDVVTLDGPNLGDATSTDNHLDGDPDLDALIPGFETFDATVLEFDFQCATSQEVSFQYAFGSEEYNEYVDSPYNDVFGFFLNGVNIATVPLGCSDPGLPVAINHVNCGNPFVGAGLNCDCYRNNDLDDGGGSIDSEMDGLTQVFFASGTIQPGLNHMKIAIADAGDWILDSNVMIRCQSFVCGAAPLTGACCLPDGPCVTLTEDDCDGSLGSFQGELVPCQPDPCVDPRGACCRPESGCQIEDQNGCERQGGVYEGDDTVCDPDPCAPSEVGEVGPGTQPTLLSVQPQPSRGTSEVSWTLPRETHARLTLWDAAGRERGTLFEGREPAGSSRRSFDLDAGTRERLASGVYWLKLETEAGSVTTKVILAR